METSSWIMAAIVVPILGLLLAGCLAALSGNTERAKRVATPAFKAPPASSKQELDEMERSVFEKADRVREMADNETKILNVGGPPSPNLSSSSSDREVQNDTETSIMRAVSKKVQKIQDLSDMI